jgi:hypothetical protein
MSTTAEQSLTHHARLILDNDYDRYQERRALVRAFLTSEDAPYPHLLGDTLKDWCEGIVARETDSVAPGLASEILTTALAFVDWRGMAESYIEEEGE